MGSEDSQTAAGAFLGAIHRLGNAALPRNPTLTPTCLICLETLTTEEFEVGLCGSFLDHHTCSATHVLPQPLFLNSYLFQRGNFPDFTSCQRQELCGLIFSHLMINASQGGEAIVLDCECRGEMAMRHRACAEKWTQVKVWKLLSMAVLAGRMMNHIFQHIRKYLA